MDEEENDTSSNNVQPIIDPWIEWMFELFMIVLITGCLGGCVTIAYLILGKGGF